MTLERGTVDTGFAAESPPVGGLLELRGWAAQQFARVAEVMRQPRVWLLMMSRQEASDMEALADGLFAWLGANVAGAGKPEGLYFRIGGTWKQVTLT